MWLILIIQTHSVCQCYGTLCTVYAQKWTSVCIKYVFKCLFYTIVAVALKREAFVSLLANVIL